MIEMHKSMKEKIVLTFVKFLEGLRFVLDFFLYFSKKKIIEKNH